MANSHAPDNNLIFNTLLSGARDESVQSIAGGGVQTEADLRLVIPGLPGPSKPKATGTPVVEVPATGEAESDPATAPAADHAPIEVEAADAIAGGGDHEDTHNLNDAPPTQPVIYGGGSLAVDDSLARLLALANTPLNDPGDTETERYFLDLSEATDSGLAFSFHDYQQVHLSPDLATADGLETALERLNGVDDVEVEDAEGGFVITLDGDANHELELVNADLYGGELYLL